MIILIMLTTLGLTTFNTNCKCLDSLYVKYISTTLPTRINVTIFLQPWHQNVFVNFFSVTGYHHSWHLKMFVKYHMEHLIELIKQVAQRTRYVWHTLHRHARDQIYILPSHVILFKSSVKSTEFAWKIFSIPLSVNRVENTSMKYGSAKYLALKMYFRGKDR